MWKNEIRDKGQQLKNHLQKYQQRQFFNPIRMTILSSKNIARVYLINFFYRAGPAVTPLSWRK